MRCGVVLYDGSEIMFIFIFHYYWMIEVSVDLFNGQQANDALKNAPRSTPQNERKVSKVWTFLMKNIQCKMIKLVERKIHRVQLISDAVLQGSGESQPSKRELFDANNPDHVQKMLSVGLFDGGGRKRMDDNVTLKVFRGILVFSEYVSADTVKDIVTRVKDENGRMCDVGDVEHNAYCGIPDVFAFHRTAGKMCGEWRNDEFDLSVKLWKTRARRIPREYRMSWISTTVRLTSSLTCYSYVKRSNPFDDVLKVLS